MRIGVDVDGVLTDIGSFMRRFGEKYFSENYGMHIKDPAGYNIEEMFGCTSKLRKRFWWKYGYKYIVEQPSYDGCAETLERIRQKGNEIYIITSRTMAAGHNIVSAFFRSVLRRWLKKNRIEYSKIVFCREKECAEDKLAACRENSIDVMIEDKIENVLAVKEAAKTLCYVSPWNEKLLCNDVIYVHNWKEIEDAINIIG